MKKFIRITLAIIIVLIGAALAAPYFLKDKIINAVKTAANDNLNATFDFKDLDISLIRNFPSVYVALIDVSIVGKNEFKNDTLAAISLLSVKADFWKLIASGTTQIKYIGISQPRIHLIALKNGKVNWDIAKSSESSSKKEESSAFHLSLQRYEIINGWIAYRDEALAMNTLVENLNHSGTGDFTQDNFLLTTTTEIERLTYSYSGINYLLNAKVKLNAGLNINNKTATYTFAENELNINEFPINFNGFIAMPGSDITMDIKFNSPKTDFKYLMSLIPGVYKDNFKDVQSSGQLAFNGFVKGTYNDRSMPGFGINLSVDKGNFKYPSLPASINNVNLKLAVSNSDGDPDHTITNLSQLHAELDAEPVDARLYVVTPVSNPTFDAMLKGSINLSNIKNYIPLDNATLSGLFKSDVNINGNMKAIEAKQFEKIKADGWMSLSNLSYKPKDSYAVKINDLKLVFNPRTVQLDNLDAQVGKSDFRAKGAIDNLLGYYFKKELLKGTFSMSSYLVDLNQFMSSSPSKETPDTAQSSVIEIPENIDFSLTASIGKLLYENKILEQLKGNVALRDRTLGLNDLRFNTSGGAVLMNGVYHTKEPKSPYFNFDLGLQNFDIQTTVKTFSTVKQVAAIAERCNGKFSSNFTVVGRMNEHMDPVLPSLNGGGKLSTQNVSLTNFEPVNKMADVLKMSQYRSMNLSNINLSFKFKDGRVVVEPFETTLAGTKAIINGSSGFDQSIDYTIGLNIPKAMLGAGAIEVANGLFANVNKAIGTGFTLPDPVKINVNMLGTVQKPEIKTSVKDAGKGMIDEAKEKALEQLDAKKQELENKAKAEAERLKNEAEEKAKAEADRLKKEAEAKAKAESDRLKKEAEEKAKKEAEDKLKNIFNKKK
jgi:hypothetical protein